MGDYYAPSTGGFYTESVQGDNIPADKIEITRAEYKALRQGGNIAIGPSGRPENKPSYWHTLNSAGDAWEITTENQALKDANEADATRKEDNITARQSGGFLNKTIAEKKAAIDNLFSSVSDSEAMKAPTVQALKKLVAYLFDE